MDGIASAHGAGRGRCVDGRIRLARSGRGLRELPFDPQVAHPVVCGLLRSAGIDCAYRDTEAIDSVLEDFIASGPREILVREADVDAARALLADSTR